MYVDDIGRHGVLNQCDKLAHGTDEEAHQSSR
jgi:hypothetical protein